MSMFFDVLSAINNPDSSANVPQLASIMNSVQSLTTNRGMQPNQVQSMVSIVGNMIRPVLKQQQTTIGTGRLENLISQVVASGASGSSLTSLLSPQLMQQISETVTKQTGMSPNLVQSALPTVVSAVLGMLQMGAPQTGAWGNSNPLLNSFLDSDGDGDTDLGDVMKFANRFLNPNVA
ncbi:hypothetical protein DSM106972_016430 [Dulcicalothrix desertica PCC 7102]|uniref:DUF937 domain-containing protein n=1 Tax=Dulcicalothrix desertica PCC 7102 TaxID=232991 RepID=A0A433VR11_9CYAN|nr:DUF937 domain-containing protein [Dulcicalothrix desertica]RUT08475.1 hypothetical protein DSM106972_016430 [Dulcicalothrix desertica PCC 7102]TWH40337.1 hypothetical protein CAL7102_09649 [Dulcicalothrix desertica PCC 7102]